MFGAKLNYHLLETENQTYKLTEACDYNERIILSR